MVAAPFAQALTTVYLNAAPRGNASMEDGQMRAIAVRGGKGGPEALEVVNVPVPQPGAGEILIRVRAPGGGG
jgi:hypothetical protein